MKTFFRVLVVSLFLTTLGVIAGNAQDETTCPDLDKCFTKYRELRKMDCGKQDEAVKYGKYIVEKWGDDELNKELVGKIKTDAEKIEKDNATCKATTQRNSRYNDSYKAKNWDEFFLAGKDIINAPATDKGIALDVMLDLVSVGLNNAVAKNDKFNNETIMYGKMALQNLGSGVTSKNFGVFEPFKTKDNAISWVNYIIGYVLYDRQGTTVEAKKDEAMPYFYKATLMGEKKTDSSLFIRIGTWYSDKATGLFNEFTKMRETMPTAANDEEKAKIDKESKAKLSLARAYAERAIDAYARAQKLAAAEQPVNTTLVKGLTDEITKLYKFRFNGKTTGQPEFVNALISRPMPDPSVAVTPVAEDTPATTTTSTTTTMTKPDATVKTTTETNTKSNSTDGSMTTKTTTTKAATTTTKAKTPVKPVVKKKGTR